MAEDIKKMPVGAGLPEMPEEIVIAPKKVVIDWKRIIFILLGLALFFRLLFHARICRMRLIPAAKYFHLPPGRQDGHRPLSHGRGLVDL